MLGFTLVRTVELQALRDGAAREATADIHDKRLRELRGITPEKLKWLEEGTAHIARNPGKRKKKI